MNCCDSLSLFVCSENLNDEANLRHNQHIKVNQYDETILLM